MAATADSPAISSSRPRVIVQVVAGRLTGAVIVIAALVIAAYVTRLYYIYPRTDDAYVRANIVGVAPHVSGPIVELLVHDNQHVKQGDLLFVVDPRPYKSVLDAAQARLTLTNLDIQGLQASIGSATSRQAQL